MYILEADHVLTAPVMNLAALLKLIEQEALVLRIPGFIAEEACRSISKGLKSKGFSDYLNAPSVGRIGMSYFETGRKQEIIDHYFSTALENINILREACNPYPCPIDTLRCVLDEVWPAGCNLQTLSGKKMFIGLSRCMQPSIPLLAHHDMFGRHAPGTPEAVSLRSQFGLNVYVDVPEVGGELAMWKEEMSDDAFLERRGENYGIPLEMLPAPDFKVKPANGDLIIFNARKIHAVMPGFGADRITLSGFLGYRGRQERLSVWS
jgi:hypothetical protein